jgi:hypothetical protein
VDPPPWTGGLCKDGAKAGVDPRKQLVYNDMFARDRW